MQSKRHFFCLLLSLFTLGCGSSHYQVRGKVEFPDGTPMESGWIIFQKSEDTEVHTADGPIIDGTFELRSTRPGDGVPAGTYKVAIRPPSPSLATKLPPLIDLKYSKFETSNIELSVEPKNNHFKIQVTKPANPR